MLTESGTQAIDLLCRFLIEPGDTVLVDDPCYFNFHALLRAHRAKVVSVPYTPSGPDIELFAQALAEHRPRLYITNSAIHNPTGAILSPVTAHRAAEARRPVGPDHHRGRHLRRFRARAGARALRRSTASSRVVHIGSFSKTLSASVRCGFIAAPPRLDRATHRPQDRHHLRRRPARGRTGADAAQGRQLSQAHGLAAGAAFARHGRDERPPEGDRHHALDRASRPACSCGAACRMAWMRPKWPAVLWPTTSCSRPAMRSACRRPPAVSCASTLPSRETSGFSPRSKRRCRVDVVIASQRGDVQTSRTQSRSQRCAGSASRRGCQSMEMVTSTVVTGSGKLNMPARAPCECRSGTLAIRSEARAMASAAEKPETMHTTVRCSPSWFKASSIGPLSRPRLETLMWRPTAKRSGVMAPRLSG